MIDEEGHLKLADFGLSKEIEGITDTFCGSPEYMSPEMLIQSGHSLTTDVYALGAILYEMVTGLPPYYSVNKDEIYENILFKDISYPQTLRPSLRNFLSAMLRKAPKKRIGARWGMEEIKRHAWCREIDWEGIQKKLHAPPYLPNLRKCNFETEFLTANYSGTNSIITQNESTKKETITYLQEASISPLTTKSPIITNNGSNYIMDMNSYQARDSEKELEEDLRPNTKYEPQNPFTSFLEVSREGEKQNTKSWGTRGASNFTQYLGQTLGDKDMKEEESPGLSICTPQTDVSTPTPNKSFYMQISHFDIPDSMIPIEHNSPRNPSIIVVPSMDTKAFPSLKNCLSMTRIGFTSSTAITSYDSDVFRLSLKGEKDINNQKIQKLGELREMFD